MLIGRVGKDPEIRRLQGGAVTSTISLATTEKYKDRNGEVREITEWHSVIAWRHIAEFVENHVQKGALLYVEGKIRTRSWDDQNGQKRYLTEIQADVVQLLSQKSSHDSNMEYNNSHDDMPY